MVMTKREALEKCKDQWLYIAAQLENYAVMAESPGVRIEIRMHQLKRDYFADEEIPLSDMPINLCYLCQYVIITTGTSPQLRIGVKCSECLLTGHAWIQCEADSDSPYALCEDAIERYDYKEAAKYAQAIVEACDQALANLIEEA